jgi:hypothetical protein
MAINKDDNDDDEKGDSPRYQRLWSEGVTCLELSPSHALAVRRAFAGFVAALPSLRSGSSSSSSCCDISSGAVDAHNVTGYHPAGVLPWSAASNLYREGMVWSRNGRCHGGQQEKCARLPPPLCKTAEDIDDPSEVADDRIRVDSDDQVSDEVKLDQGRRSRRLNELREWSDPMERMLLSIGLEVLEQVERRLDLPPGWFHRHMLLHETPTRQELRPHCDDTDDDDTIDRRPPSSFPSRYGLNESNHHYHQWHMKNYELAGNRGVSCCPAADDDAMEEKNGSAADYYATKDQPPPRTTRWEVVLPAHTDPSLVSVVVLDRAPASSDGAGRSSLSQGLECWNRNSRQWEPAAVVGGDAPEPDAREDEEALKESGFAIVLIGSVLSFMTGGYLHAPLHRVVVPVDDGSSNASALSGEDGPITTWHRRAATLFLRPAPSALLQVPPSPRLAAMLASQSSGPARKLAATPVTFKEWNTRVSRNYRRRRRRRRHPDQDKPPS